MSSQSTFYVTTAIPYVNAAPHLGHVLELVQADVLARHARLRGRPVRFLSGTDDHALKNVLAARAAGLPVDEYVARGADRFDRVRELLGVSCDDTISTSSDPRHRRGVEHLWRRTAAAGDFYRRTYTGRYCLGCEQFYEPAELPDGRCPEHGTEPETVGETNWFFRLGRYADRVRQAIASGELRVNPVQKRNEVLALIDAGLPDISVSRPAARADGWGVPVPGDPDQVVYVWWDALANYVTALEVDRTGSAYERWWAGDDPSAERLHVVGKGITRFHAITWPALLLSAGLPLPTTVHVHDYVTVGGARLAKSTGNVVDPVELVGSYDVDAVRWWVAREVPLLGDTEFTVERLVHAHDRDLANRLGNLVHRTLTLLHRFADGRLLPRGPLASSADGLCGEIDAALADADLRAATGHLVGAVDVLNAAINDAEPWRVFRDGDPDDTAHQLLSDVVRAARVVVSELTPFVPDGAARLAVHLGIGEVVGRPAVVFKRLNAG